MPAKSIKYQYQLTKGVPTPKILEMVGRKFGRLTVERYAGYRITGSGQKNQYVWCLCECGNRVLGATGHLMGGKWRSCGCLRVDEPNRRVHGYAPLSGKREKIYHAWHSMHSRCNPNKNNSTRRYHEKGVKVCDGWSGKFGFLNFKEAMYPPTDKSIDRIDNDLHYSCGKCGECKENGWQLNCRWGNDDIQANNRGDFNHWVVLDGVKMTYRQASRYLGFREKLLQERVVCCGWDERRAITTPCNGIVPKQVKYEPYTKSK